MFKNLVALVTGGASGLGRATVEHLTKLGSRVVFCDLPTSDGAQVCKEIDGNVTYIPANVTQENDVKHVMQEIDRLHGQLNVVVNCAGIMFANCTYNFYSDRATDQSRFDAVLKTNVVGTLNVIRLAVELMERSEADEKQWRGIIVNTAGTEGIRGTMSQAVNGAAARAVIAMTVPLAQELRQAGIRVVTIAPGLLDTPNIDYLPLDVRNTINQNCFIAPNRLGYPIEYSHLVTSCIQNTSINGSVIELDAGLDVNF